MAPIDMLKVLRQCEFADWTFDLINDQGFTCLRARFNTADVKTGEVVSQPTRKWVLSQHMTLSEIVQTVFKCVMTAMEHEVRERFAYRKKAIFGPHFDVDQLVPLVGDAMEDRRAIL